MLCPTIIMEHTCTFNSAPVPSTKPLLRYLVLPKGWVCRGQTLGL